MELERRPRGDAASSRGLSIARRVRRLARAHAAALATEAAWERVDAVLYVGEDTPPLPPGWANEESLREPVGEKTSEDSQRAKAPRGYPKPFKHVPMRYAKAARRDVADGLDACLEFIRSNARGRTLVACKDGVDHRHAAWRRRRWLTVCRWGRRGR